MQLALDRIKALGASVMAISPETPESSLLVAVKNKVTFEMLSDVGNAVAREFGIVFQFPEELRSVYAEFGIDVPMAAGDKTFELPIPATYIIGSDGRILEAFVEADYTKRLDPEEIIEMLKRLERAAWR